MKKIKLTLGILIIVIASAFTLVQSVNWKLREDAYSVSFKGGKEEGVMKGLKASILFDEVNPEKSKVTASIDVTTINTGNGMKNKHAQSEEALDSKNFPTITFESESVSGKSGSYLAKGKLTMKGVVKEIDLPFTFEHKGGESLFKGKFTIAPKDFNITRNGTPDVLEIDLLIPVTK